MNFRLLIPVLLSAAVLTTGCDTTSEARRKERKPRYGYQGEESSTATETLPPKPSSPSPSASSDADSEPAPPPPPMTPSNQGTAAGTVKVAPPYAIKVPDKPGYVTSPRAPYAGVIDVRGYAPGTEIRDPWSPGQTLLVP